MLDSLATTAKLDFRPVLSHRLRLADRAPTTPRRRARPRHRASPRRPARRPPRARRRPSAARPARPRRRPSNGAAGHRRPQSATSASPSPSATPSPSPSASGDGAGAGELPADPVGQRTTPPCRPRSPRSTAPHRARPRAARPTRPSTSPPARTTARSSTCSTRRRCRAPRSPARQAGLWPRAASGWEVNLTFTAEGATQFAEVTGEARAEPVAAEPVRASRSTASCSPRRTCPSAILGGSAVITGSFTADEAKALANVLKYGSLPVALEVSSVEQLSPTLGQDQLDAGLIAGRARPAARGHLPRASTTARSASSPSRRSLVAAVITYDAVRHPGPAARVHPVPRRRRRRDRRDRHHRRLVRRLLRTHPGRDPRGPEPAQPRATSAGSAPAARSSPPTSCRCSPPWCCTSCRSAASAASPSPWV